MTTLANLFGCVQRIKSGWKSSEFYASTGGAGVILTVAQLNQPLMIRVVGMIAIAAVTIAYAVLRTWIKIASQPPIVSQTPASQYLESQFGLVASGGNPTNPATAPKRASLEKVSGS